MALNNHEGRGDGEEHRRHAHLKHMLPTLHYAVTNESAFIILQANSLPTDRTSWRD